jgi:CDP-2,3-bis-(O-geranylgeranyl)-sn-glycerol synthase
MHSLLTAAARFVDPVALTLLIAANATPVLAARLLGDHCAAPIHARTFGTHKSWRGILAGLLACAGAGALLPCGAGIGAGVGVLALAGDLASSFVKRRLRLPAGTSAPLLDQLPEAMLPLLVFARPLELDGSAVFGTALLFTVLDLLTGRLRERPAKRSPDA